MRRSTHLPALPPDARPAEATACASPAEDGTVSPRLASARLTARRSTAGAGAALVLVALGGLGAHPAQATDLSYTLLSPAFGGTDPAALQAAEYDKSLEQTRAANAAAAAAATAQAAANTPTQQFATAIESQLNSLVARDVALQVANSTPGQAGTIQSGDVSLTYINSDGQLNITINTPTGSTTMTLPTGD